MVGVNTENELNLQRGTTPGTLHHNTFAEIVNRTLVEPARVMMEEVDLSTKYW